MAKGIDPKFVHYGIRKDDLAMIEAICEAEGVDFDWLSEDILMYLANLHTSFLCNLIYPTFSRILLYSC